MHHQASLPAAGPAGPATAGVTVPASTRAALLRLAAEASGAVSVAEAAEPLVAWLEAAAGEADMRARYRALAREPVSTGAEGGVARLLAGARARYAERQAAVWRAALEAGHRAEAVALAAEPPWEQPESEADEMGEAREIPGRCPRCRARVTVGVTVMIRHLPGCAAAAVKSAAYARAHRTGRAAGPPSLVTSPAPCATAVPPPPLAGPAAVPAAAAGIDGGQPDVRPTVRHRNRRGQGQERASAQRGCAYTTASSRFTPEPEPENGMRPWVVARWFVSGARVWAWVADAGRWVMATARRIIRGENGGLRVRVDFDEWPSHARVDIEKGWEFSDLEPERAGAW